VDYDPFIKSQLASRNQLQDLMWCKFGHVSPLNLRRTKPRFTHHFLPRAAATSDPVERLKQVSSYERGTPVFYCERGTPVLFW